jgi:hypothetical protein
MIAYVRTDKIGSTPIFATIINLNLLIMEKLEYSIINFAYFTANFPSNFIKECWKEDGQIKIDHLTKKLVSYKETGFISIGSFMNFFFDLDRTNQEKLVLWIDKNYSYRG